jgi:hypothetical protein
MQLSWEDRPTVQQIDRGWALRGIAVVGASARTTTLAVAR